MEFGSRLVRGILQHAPALLLLLPLIGVVVVWTMGRGRRDAVLFAARLNATLSLALAGGLLAALMGSGSATIVGGRGPSAGTTTSLSPTALEPPAAASEIPTRAGIARTQSWFCVTTWFSCELPLSLGIPAVDRVREQAAANGESSAAVGGDTSSSESEAARTTRRHAGSAGAVLRLEFRTGIDRAGIVQAFFVCLLAFVVVSQIAAGEETRRQRLVADDPTLVADDSRVRRLVTLVLLMQAGFIGVCVVTDVVFWWITWEASGLLALWLHAESAPRTSLRRQNAIRLAGGLACGRLIFAAGLACTATAVVWMGVLTRPGAVIRLQWPALTAAVGRAPLSDVTQAVWDHWAPYAFLLLGAGVLLQVPIAPVQRFWFAAFERKTSAGETSEAAGLAAVAALATIPVFLAVRFFVPLFPVAGAAAADWILPVLLAGAVWSAVCAFSDDNASARMLPHAVAAHVTLSLAGVLCGHSAGVWGGMLHAGQLSVSLLLWRGSFAFHRGEQSIGELLGIARTARADIRRETAAAQNAVARTSVAQTSFAQTSVAQASGAQTSVAQTSVAQTSVNRKPAGQKLVGRTGVDETGAEQTVANGPAGTRSPIVTGAFAGGTLRSWLAAAAVAGFPGTAAFVSLSLTATALFAAYPDAFVPITAVLLLTAWSVLRETGQLCGLRSPAEVPANPAASGLTWAWGAAFTLLVSIGCFPQPLLAWLQRF